MWKRLAMGMLLVGLLATAACGGDGKAKVQVIPVQVDGRTSSFAAAFLAYFPSAVQAHPGDEIDFTSVFNGEPHTVTLGTNVDAIFNLIAQACPNGGLADPSCQQGPPAGYADQYSALDAKLPQFLPEGPGDVIQAAGAPCYLATGDAPADGSACTAAQQTQTAFDGTQTYYNSGFLPEAAIFKVKLADTIAPGTYNYYCLLHREGMAGTITVVGEDTTIPSVDDVKAQGQDELDQVVAALQPAFDKLASLTADSAVAGAFSPDIEEAAVNEFGPKEISIPVGGSVTWTVSGPHTISFNAPSSATGVITRGSEGLHHANQEAFAPSNGPGQPQDPSASPLIDAGEWDGEGFLSSGLILSFGEPAYQYKVTFTKAGNYPYFCLIHPGMGGTVTVQ